jgi:ATP-dependent exoDNAse (exonuclease V) beta subunit
MGAGARSGRVVGGIVNELSDQAERDRFITAHGKNISVIAPAGVGKTRAIVERIVALARQPEALAVDRLSRLIVVTYSVRAAQQMQQRARAAIREAGVSPRVQRAFQQTFFGTIHSYCVRLLDRFGHYLGLPSPVGLLQNHEEWWNRFLTRGLGQVDAGGHLQELFHFFAPEKLYALGKEVSPGPELEVGPSPELDLRALLAFSLEGLHPSTKRSLAAAQAEVARWSEAWARGDRFHPLPKSPETQAKDPRATAFVELWAATFAPLHDWLGQGGLAFGRRIANAYESFRLGEAVMTYDDQVRMALRLLNHPAVQRELAQERPSVLLDEAQDTDPRQFEVLQRVAGLGPGTKQAEDQSFCIVGDFQQVIYAPRSDLSVYRDVHDKLIVEPRGAESRLKVTFRCDEAIIRFVNRIFPSVLHGGEGQSAFFDLMPRHAAGPGQVARWLCPDETQHAAGAKVKSEVRARHEARFLAGQIKAKGCAGLGADSWSQVAILCPRRNWLVQIMRELSALEIPAQFHSSDETQNDRTPATWLTALIWIAAHPEDSFEIVGVLREIFGVSDHDLARFTQGEGERLRLDRPGRKENGAVAAALQILREALEGAASRPLHQVVGRLVEKTGLRERLRSIRDYEPEGSEHDFDDFLSLILDRAARGATLAELAAELRLNLRQSSPAEQEVRDAIQLLTAHKAKGLEWQTVIVPYLFRPIETKTPAYPRLVQGEGGREMIFRDKSGYDSHAKAFVSARDRQQLQRLLYVTCTRAKQTLLLIDDENLFDGQMQRGGWSSAELLGFLGGVNRITWEALPETLAAAAPSKTAAMEEAMEEELPTLGKREVARAIEWAGAIPRRQTPHAFAVYPPPESEPEVNLEREENQAHAAAENPGILYGTWWHEFVQTVPWGKPREEWERRFAAALPRSPQAERSGREWELFCGSDLASWLAAPGRIVHREIPFLWLEEADACLEGVIDLAVFTPGEGWRVIDWKTNRGSGAELVDIYRGQIGAYVRALEKMLSAEVKGSLYLTSSGAWVPVE